MTYMKLLLILLASFCYAQSSSCGNEYVLVGETHGEVEPECDQFGCPEVDSCDSCKLICDDDSSCAAFECNALGDKFKCSFNGHLTTTEECGPLCESQTVCVKNSTQIDGAKFVSDDSNNRRQLWPLSGGPQNPTCLSGFQDATNGNAYWWGCGSSCPGGQYWTDYLCRCACQEPRAGQNFGNKQRGFCVHANGADQNTGVIKASPAISDEDDCLSWCENHGTYFTGCEFIYGPQTNWGCYGHTYEVARANGAEYHTCWIKNERPTLGARQNGFCVTSNGGDQNSNVVRSSDYWANLYSSSCKDWCDLQSGITGCEFIWGQWNYGCYAHNSAVSRGNGVDRHYCWIAAKRRNLGGAGRKL